MSNRTDQPEVAKSDTFGRPSRSRSVRRVRRNDILTARDLSVIRTEGHWVIVQCRACPCFRKAIQRASSEERTDARGASDVLYVPERPTPHCCIEARPWAGEGKEWAVWPWMPCRVGPY